ncbi:unnamed protein product [Orchesella dallaii]|uniref:Uncharacterized protein n=1 Tax=Orchesella dallaii TaxID=48710 RepID=A0ABP1RE41_9HEXA
MACLASEKSPLAQKRCSLPGPGGALGLYAAHQQRRLSERGLMIYKPNKPDIDLIRDFTNANPRKQSTPNITLYPGVPGPSCASGGSLKYAHGTFGSLTQLNRNLYSPASTSAGPSPSAYRRNSSLASFSSYASPSHGGGSSTDGAGSSGNNTNNTNGSSTSTSSAAAGGTARKVRIRIQKNPGATTEKYVELHSIGKKTTSSTSGDEDQEGDGGLDGDEMTEDERNLFLRSPLFDARRFSDSAVCRGPTPAITFSLTSDVGDGNSPNNPGVTTIRRASDSSGIVLSTGDLETLKCLTSSAQEISSTGTSDKTEGDVSPTNLGNRSKSFDATLSVRRGLGSSWFARRHLPISHKLPSAASNTANQPLPQLRTPILTITNENACQSELIEIPSPPTVTPVSSGGSPGEVTSTVTWDRNGYMLDAALLGSAIENHLKEGNRKRRATFSTLYQAPPSSVECKVTTRARSASACVIPINPKELQQQSSSGGRRESIGTDRVIPNFPLSEKGNRRSSLKSIVRFPWDSCKDPQSPETKSLLWSESPVEYTNSGSFIRTTVTDFGADCIDEEDEESRTPETTNTTSTTTTTTTSGGSNNGSATVFNTGLNNMSNREINTSSSSANGGNGKKGIRGFELPSSSKGKGAVERDAGSSHSHSAPASPKPNTKRVNQSRC